jgi:hypothetical protein
VKLTCFLPCHGLLLCSQQIVLHRKHSRLRARRRYLSSGPLLWVGNLPKVLCQPTWGNDEAAAAPDVGSARWMRVTVPRARPLPPLRRTNCGAPKSYRNTSDTYPESGPLLYGMIPGPKNSRTGRFRDPRYRVRDSCHRLTPVSAHRSVTAGQMGSRPMVFGRPRYAGDLNAVACVRATGNRYGSPRRGRRAQALKSSQLLAPSLGSTDG